VRSCNGDELNGWRVVRVTSCKMASCRGASCQSGELSGWRVVKVASCQGGELYGHNIFLKFFLIPNLTVPVRMEHDEKCELRILS
jgi:hypothetical protein